MFKKAHFKKPSISENKPHYDCDDAIDFIAKSTGFGKDVILDILAANDHYLKRIGAIEDLSDEDIEAFWKES